MDADLTFRVKQLSLQLGTSEQKLLGDLLDNLDHSPENSHPNFSVEDLEDRFVFHNVVYEGKERTYTMFKDYDTNYRSQDNCVSFLSAKGQKLISAPELGAVFEAMYDNKKGGYKKEIRAAKKFFREILTKHMLMTGSMVIYNPDGNDKVIHNYGLEDVRTIDANLVGPDGYVGREHSSVIQSVFGTDNVPKHRKVMRYISGKPEYLLRINSTVDNQTERPVQLNVSNVVFVVNVDYVNYDGVSLGWVFDAEKSP